MLNLEIQIDSLCNCIPDGVKIEEIKELTKNENGRDDAKQLYE